MSTTLKRLRKMLFFAFTLLALVASSAVAVYADIYWMQTSGGYTFWLSCGSSAGNYYYKCDGQGNCDDCETQACTDSANDQCAMHGD